ncbi:hypothetical protein HanRHA438_Chr04g0186121 [Helianthus annuus]|nr:hypothetical protein HanRHA438_Chr04g0186121 [Helianthus annuus]
MRQQGSARRCTPSAIRSVTKSRQRTPVRLVAPPCGFDDQPRSRICTPVHPMARPCETEDQSNLLMSRSMVDHHQ